MDPALPNDMRCEIYAQQTDAQDLMNLMATSKDERELVRRCVKEINSGIPDISFIWQFRNLERVKQRLNLNTAAEIYLTATMEHLTLGYFKMTDFVRDILNFLEIYVYGPVRENDSIIYYNRDLSTVKFLFLDAQEHYYAAIVPNQLVLTYDRSKGLPAQEERFDNIIRLYSNVSKSIEHIVIDLPTIDYWVEEELKATADYFPDVTIVVTESTAVYQLLKVGINVVIATRDKNRLSTRFNEYILPDNLEMFPRILSFTSFYRIDQTLFSFLLRLPNLNHLGIYLPEQDITKLYPIIFRLPKSIKYLTVYTDISLSPIEYEGIEVEYQRDNYLIFNANNLRKYFNLPDTVL